METFVTSLKALADKIRLRIVWILSQANTELCVCEIMDVLHETQYNISRHLKVLKTAGWVQERKEARWVFYTLTPPQNPFQECLRQAILALPEELFGLDKARLIRRLALREDGRCTVGVDSEAWRSMVKELAVMGEKG